MSSPIVFDEALVRSVVQEVLHTFARSPASSAPAAPVATAPAILSKPKRPGVFTDVAAAIGVG